MIYCLYITIPKWRVPDEYRNYTKPQLIEYWESWFQTAVTNEYKQKKSENNYTQRCS